MGLGDFFRRGKGGSETATDAAPPATGTASPGTDATHAADSALAKQVVAMLRTIYDPEIPVNIYDLGLLYGLEVDAVSGRVAIRMTLTAPGCPVAQTFPGQVAETVGLVEGVEEVTVDLVWEPPWTRERMSQAARLELGML